MTAAEVKAIRKRLKLNTKGFGALVGVSWRTVEEWEQGRRSPSRPAVKVMQTLAAKDGQE